MLDTIWLGAQQRLRDELAEKDYDTWIAPLKATKWAGGALTLETPSGFFRDWLKRHFLAVLEHAVSRASGGPASVVLVINRQLDVPAVAPAGPAPRAPVPPAVADAPARYTFDDFVVGKSNQVAFAAAQAIVQRPGTRFNPLFVYGGVGLGKTHLLCAIENGLAAQSHHGRVERISAEEFVNQMIAALKSQHMDRFRRRFRAIATLVIDDIQFLVDKKRSQEEFCHTFNALHDGRRQIVIASDRPPQQMPGVEEALRSRFASGLLAHISAPDPAMRLVLVRRKAAARGLVLDPEVESLLAEGWCGNVRILEGALLKLDAVVSFGARGPIDRALVEQMLGGREGGRGPECSVDEVLGEVCAATGVSLEDLRGPGRTKSVTAARQLAMLVCQEETKTSVTAIGHALRRDHSTVIHGLKRTTARLRESAEFRRLHARVKARLRK